MTEYNQASPRQLWQEFQERERLTEEQITSFQRYKALLLAWNKRVNLTSITSLKEILALHFSDSLVLRRFIDVKSLRAIGDVGTGGGFPSLPLKIVFPHLNVMLIEVAQKKQAFLREVIRELALDDVVIFGCDWRTFLRTTQEDVDLFVARASLSVVELCRVFKPACFYNTTLLAYWASGQWEPESKIVPFVRSVHPYTSNGKQRKLVIMKTIKKKETG